MEDRVNAEVNRIEQMNRLRCTLGCDFAAVAIADGKRAGKLQWTYVSGQTNERYKRMLVSRGKGLAGKALLLGRGVTEYAGPSSSECPIMIAESLICSAAIPLEGGLDLGVLQIGYRSRREYSAVDLERMEMLAQQFAAIWKE